MTRDPVQEAERFLSMWKTISPTRIPVDPVRIAKELGIDVFDGELDAEVSGAIYKRPGSDPTIILNRSDSNVRQRFACAHELGHYVLRSDTPEAFEYVDQRASLASTGLDDDERFANNFAASLLMPEGEVRSQRNFTPSAVQLAFHFKVSQEAMVYRLTNLGLPVE